MILISSQGFHNLLYVSFVMTVSTPTSRVMLTVFFFSPPIIWNIPGRSCYTHTMARSGGRDKADHYSQQARREGYPARSVYKLEEIQTKFTVIHPGDRVLDIGAAPGSWTLYVHRKLLGPSGSITAVDLKQPNLQPVPDRVTFYQGDAFAPEICELLVAGGPYQAVISDAAPATTGNRSVDCSRSEGLAESVIALAEEHLMPGGSLVIKVFQGGGEQQLVQKMRTLFGKVKPFKPAACRNDSFEIFLVGLDRRPMDSGDC